MFRLGYSILVSIISYVFLTTLMEYIKMLLDDLHSENRGDSVKLENLKLYYNCPFCGREHSFMPYAEPSLRTEPQKYCDCGYYMEKEWESGREK